MMLMWCAVCWDTQELLQLLPSPPLAVLRMGQYGLMMVNCTGNENTLAACPHVGWGNSDCDHDEDAGVICDFNYTVDAKGKGDAW